jgi:Asp/Glu/hydantoin racemase
MKIWCQSCGAFGKSPIWNDYEQALRKHAEEVTRPDTVVELHGVETTIPGIDQYYASQTICVMQSIKNAIRAEREGFDVYVMINTRDAGYKEIRELVDIPTVFMLENCIHFAMMLGPEFAFFTHNRELLLRLTELTKQYGLAEHMAPGGHLSLSYSDWPNLFGSPERYTELITQKIKEIIAQGADILIPSAVPLNMWLLKQNLIEIDGARILDGVGCALKMAELMVDLKKIGIIRKKCGPLSSDMLLALQKLYGG